MYIFIDTQYFAIFECIICIPYVSEYFYAFVHKVLALIIIFINTKKHRKLVRLKIVVLCNKTNA